MNACKLFIFISLVVFNVRGQEITITDKLTQQRIPGVKIYSINPKINVLSNVEGRFRLEPFIGCDSIIFSYSGYKTEIFSYSDLRNKTGIELTDDNLSLDPLVVTANRWEQELSKVPFKITALDVKSVAIQGHQTTADLLSGSGYVFVQRSQLAGGSPQLRGFGANRVLIVVDGVRMNNAIFRSGNLQNVISIDANSLESAEVLFGPGAVMYGSDAIGGVMDFRTKKARFTTDSVKALIKTNVYSRFSTVNKEFSNHLDFTYGGKKWAFVSAVSYNIFNDLMSGSYGDSTFLLYNYQTGSLSDQQIATNDDPRVQRYSGYNQLNLIQKIAFQPKKNHIIEYSGIYTESSEAVRYDRMIQDANQDGTPDYFDWHYGPQVWMMHNLNYSGSRTTGFYENIKIIAAYQNFKESRHDVKWGSTTYRRQYERVNALSLNLDLEKSMGSRVDLFYGTEYVINKIGSHSVSEPLNGDQVEINPRYPDNSMWQSAGAYLNSEIALSDKFQLNTGARCTYYHISAEFDTALFAYPVTSMQNDNSALSGSAGLVYNPGINTRFYFNLATGFRAPNIDDMGKVFDSQPGSVVVPNPDLKPETVYSIELGFKKIIKRKVMLEGALFYTYLNEAMTRSNYTFNGKDSIVYDGEMSRVQAIQNLSHAYVYGFQAGLEYTILQGFKLAGTFNYQKGYEYQTDSAAYFPKTHIAPVFGRASLRYKKSQLFLEFYCEFQGRMDSDDLPLVERDKLFYAVNEEGKNYVDEWYTLNFKASYFFNKHLSLNGGVTNITDRLYRGMGSGISAPGRNYMISLKATF